MKKSFVFRGEEMDLNYLKYIVYVDDMNDGWFGSEYVIFIFEDEMHGDFSKEHYLCAKYYLDIESKEDVIFLSENFSRIGSILGCDISIKRSVHYPFYSEVIYPLNYLGEEFYVKKEVPSFRLSWNNFYKIESLIYIFFEIITFDFFKKKNDSIYVINNKFFN